MTPSTHSFADDLLQHTASLRSLARDLVASPDRVEDIVQETYLRALRSPPRDRHGLLPWLSTVLRNVVRNEHRGDQRRVRREAFVAIDEVVVGAHIDDAPHAETLHRLTGALRDLPEPYRSTLTERYFSGLTPTEMARRCNTPLPTVKARLARGLELLRRALSAGNSESNGRPSDWRTGLVAAVGLPPASSGMTRPALPAILLMAPPTKLLLGMTTVATAVVAIWWLLQDPAAAVPLHNNANKQAERQSARLDTADSQTSRERVLAETRVVSPPVGLEHPYSFTLRCLAVDSDGLRCTNANLVAAPVGTAINHVPDKMVEPGVYQFVFRGRQPTLHVRVGMQRDSIGTRLHEVTLQAGQPFAVTVLCPMGTPGPPNAFEVRAFAEPGLHPFALFREGLPRTASKQDGPDLVLRGPSPKRPKTSMPRIRGVVRDENGAPVAGARVTWGHQTDVAQGSTWSRGDGSFVLNNVGLGAVKLRAGGDRHGIARTELQIDDGTDETVDLLLHPGEQLTGNVKLPDGLSPDGWRVHWRSRDRLDVDAARVGPDGNFTFANVPQATGEVLLFAQQSRVPIARLPIVVTGTEVSFDLQVSGLPASELRCEVRNANGAVATPDFEETTVHAERIESTLAARFPDLFVTHEESGYCTQVPRQGNTFSLRELAAGFYRVSLTVQGSAPIDLGRHWLDGSSPFDLGSHTLPIPGRLQVQQNKDAPRRLELYRRRPGLDVRITDVDSFDNLELPPGKWLLLGGSPESLFVQDFRVQASVTTSIDMRRR